jgi:hypothetical protein
MADLTNLANVKQWLGIATTTDDALLTRLVSAASDYIQTWLNRTFASAAYTEVRDGNGGAKLMFSNYPVTAVASVVIDGVAIPASTGPTAPGYTFSQTQLFLRGSYRFTRDMQNVSVTYTAGYAQIPNEIAQACIELVGLRYKEKDRIGIVSKGLAGETISFTQKDFSEAVATVLRNYKKVISL